MQLLVDMKSFKFTSYVSILCILCNYAVAFQKSLIMRIRISYKVNDKDVLEEGQISNFPRDL